MPLPLTISYTPGDTLGDIASTQNLAGAGDLVLNKNPFVMDPATIRLVVLDSANDLSGVAFTIVGTDINGLFLSEVLTGPNAGSATSVNTYASVFSITANAACNGIKASVGSGLTSWFLTRGTLNTSLSITVEGTVEYTIETTNSRVFVPNPTNGSQIIQNPNCNPQITDIVNEASDAFYVTPFPCNAVRVVIDGNTDATGGLIIEILSSPANVL